MGTLSIKSTVNYMLLFNQISNSQTFLQTKWPTKIVKVADHLLGGQRLLTGLINILEYALIDRLTDATNASGEK